MGASGTTTVDFGSGAESASTVITGQTGIATSSLVEAWIRADDTATHTAEEHLLEKIHVIAGSIVAGTGFTIYARPMFDLASKGSTLTGAYTVAWVWN